MKHLIKLQRNLLIPIVFLLVVFNVLDITAQKNQHEFSISGGGGFSTFLYQPPVNGVTSLGYNGDVAVGFTGFLSPHWGVHTGVGFGFIQVNAKIKELHTTTKDLIDRNKFVFDLYTTLHNYKENHQTLSLYVPLMLQFQTAQKQDRNWRKSQKVSFYAMGGVKGFFFVSNKYEAKVDSLFNAAYYPEFDNWAATQIFAGLSKFDGNKTEGNTKLNVMISFALETGIKTRIGRNLFLYTGVFFDCGLNDPLKKSRQHYSKYIYAEELERFTLLSLSKGTHLLNTGIKLRLAFFKIPKELSCPYR